MRHLVTGASSGIGRALAERLRDRGDDLVLIGRDAARLRDFPDAEVIEVDLADAAAVEAVRVDGPLDAVIHSAGVVDLSPVGSFDTEQWSAQLAVNLTAPAILTRTLLPLLRESEGTIVFVNSSAGLAASPEWSAYAASKFGLRALADSLRAEEVDHGVRVTTVFPSRTATPMQEKVHEQEGATYDASKRIPPETVADTILHVLDLPAGTTIPEVSVRPVVPRR
jgi:NAD(P)-dependent dehydrogenase (short-subunit alcohol dehydrogenase family)